MIWIWLYFEFILFLIIVPAVIMAAIPFTIIVLLPRERWVLCAGGAIVAWWMFLRYAPMQTHHADGPWGVVEIFVIVSAWFAVLAMITRFLTLQLKRHGYGRCLLSLIHTMSYLILAFLVIRRGLSLT